jgi:ribonuclease PH
LVDGQLLLDLTYDEDSRAQVDMNVVMTGKGDLVEVQGTGEGATFTQGQMGELVALARTGVTRLVEIQRAALKEIL